MNVCAPHIARWVVAFPAFRRTLNFRSFLGEANEFFLRAIGYFAIRVLSMFRPQCPFCNHANPADAKFCNDCGSPLHLQPCKQCEAINDQAANNCYKCGTEFPVSVTTTDAAAASRASDTPAASATLIDMGFLPEHSPLPGAMAEGYDSRPWWTGNATASDREPGVEAVTREPRSLGGDVSSLFSGAQRATDAVTSHNLGATAGLRPMSRAALAALLPAVLLTAVAVYAYFVYRHPPQLREWLSAVQPDSAALAGENPRGTPTRSIAEESGAPASSARPVSPDTGRAAATISAWPVPPNESSTDVRTSPVRQGGTRATGRDGVGSQTLTPAKSIAAAIPQPRVSKGDQLAARDAAANRSTATPAATGAAAPVESPLGDSRVNVPPDVPRPGTCTEAAAALGLCSPIPLGENK